MPVELTCAVCGCRFSVPPSYARAGRKFCSNKCAAVARIGEGNPRWKGGLVHFACRRCGKESVVKPSHKKNGEGNFCCRECADRWKSEHALGYDPAKRVVKHCRVCGKKLHIKQSHADTEGTYCSKECMAQDYRAVLIGEANPNFKDGKANTPEWRKAWTKRWRANNKEYISVQNRRSRARRNGAIGTHTASDIKAQYARQKGKCFWCGATVGKRYHIDHVVPLVRGGSNWPENLVISCPTCNMQKHDKLPHEWAQGGRLL